MSEILKENAYGTEADGGTTETTVPAEIIERPVSEIAAIEVPMIEKPEEDENTAHPDGSNCIICKSIYSPITYMSTYPPNIAHKIINPITP